MKGYEDIIDFDRPEPKHHPRMTMEQRAAQFSPFAALTGYEASIHEEARLTDQQRLLQEDAAAELNHRMELIREHLHEHPTLSVTYFSPDTRKDGGQYLLHEGRLLKMDEFHQILIFEDGHRIRIPSVFNIEILP